MKKFLACLSMIMALLCISTAMASTTYFDTRGTRYEGVVERMSELGIINGMSANTYAPNKEVTRAELAKIVVKMQKLDQSGVVPKGATLPFSDVKPQDWFFDYVYIAYTMGIVRGYEDNTFRPNNSVTYAEVVAMMLRYLGYTRITTDNPEGWYVNYLIKMRELDLNDNISEQDYTTNAIRGDVAMFAWNTLITSKWEITLQNEYEGFTYTYAPKTPLETYFTEYTFLDNASIRRLGGSDKGVGVWVGDKFYVTKDEILPLYAKGGRITALVKDDVLSGITYDEEFLNEKIVSGPLFFVRTQKYKISQAKHVYSIGSQEKANYVYLVVDLDTDTVIRAIYIDSGRFTIVESISIDSKKSGDEEEFKLKINDTEYSYEDTAVMRNGFSAGWSSVSKGDCLLTVEDGLYVVGSTEIEGTINQFSTDNTITINNEKYNIANQCECYIYTEEKPVLFEDMGATKVKSYIGVDVKAYLNVAEEVYRIELQKNEVEEKLYQFGFVTRTYPNTSSDTLRFVLNYGNEEKMFNIEDASKNYYDLGDLVSISKEGAEKKMTIITKDETFKNDIGVKYLYDPKTYSYPMIGEYMVTDETQYYKITLEYEENSIDEIKSCTVEEMDGKEEFDTLEAYGITLIYDEFMEVRTVFVINEKNKFDNQIALVKGFGFERENREVTEHVSLSVLNQTVVGFVVNSGEKELFESGDLITFKSSDAKAETARVEIVEKFLRESIGFKRDLIVKEYDKKGKVIHFENGEDMKVTSEIYDWNGKKINLNRFRLVFGKVSKMDGKWGFYTINTMELSSFDFKPGDRFAIGEMDDIIVVYRGYHE